MSKEVGQRAADVKEMWNEDAKILNEQLRSEVVNGGLIVAIVVTSNILQWNCQELKAKKRAKYVN